MTFRKLIVGVAALAVLTAVLWLPLAPTGAATDETAARGYADGVGLRAA